MLLRRHYEADESGAEPDTASDTPAIAPRTRSAGRSPSKAKTEE
ncbi:hypothetical protein ACIGFK_07510 [Streptomyces sp. NPDC085524]